MQTNNTAKLITGDVTPADLAAMLPGGNLLSDQRFSRDRLSIQRFCFDSFRLNVAALSHHTIALQLGGPVSIETDLEGGRRDRRWFEKGQINVHVAGSECRRSLKGRSDVLTTHLKPSLINDIYEEVYDRDPASLSLHPLLTQKDWKVSTLCQLIMSEADLGTVDMGLLDATFGQALGLHLIRQHSSASSLPSKRPVAIPVGRMKRVIEYMHQHLQANPSLPELARLSQLSQSQFSRAFREATGLPPHRYLLRLRLGRAKELLETTDTPIVDVALMCGFEHLSHFSTTFRTQVGICPRSWRIARKS